MRLVPIIRYCPREWISTLTSQANLIGPQISLEAYHSGKIKRDNSSTRFLATGRTSPPRRLRAHIRGASASAAQDLPKQPLLPRLYKYRALASRRGPRPFSPSKHSDHSSIQSPRSISQAAKKHRHTPADHRRVAPANIVRLPGVKVKQAPTSTKERRPKGYCALHRRQRRKSRAAPS